jgi:hypothetical protein
MRVFGIEMPPKPSAPGSLFVGEIRMLIPLLCLLFAQAATVIGQSSQSISKEVMRTLRQYRYQVDNHDFDGMDTARDLVSLGQPALPTLGVALTDSDDEIREMAAHFIESICREKSIQPPANVEEALRTVFRNDRSQRVRAAAFWTLNSFKPDKQLVIRSLSDRDERVREQAMSALEQGSTSTREFARMIRPLLKDPATQVRRMAVFYIERHVKEIEDSQDYSLVPVLEDTVVALQSLPKGLRPGDKENKDLLHAVTYLRDHSRITKHR